MDNTLIALGMYGKTICPGSFNEHSLVDLKNCSHSYYLSSLSVCDMFIPGQPTKDQSRAVQGSSHISFQSAKQPASTCIGPGAIR